MTATDIARKHFADAVKEAEIAGYDADSLARYMLAEVVACYLRKRSVQDVRAELAFVADNCDPDTDFMFMRP